MQQNGSHVRGDWHPPAVSQVADGTPAIVPFAGMSVRGMYPSMSYMVKCLAVTAVCQYRGSWSSPRCTPAMKVRGVCGGQVKERQYTDSGRSRQGGIKAVEGQGKTV